MKKTGEGNLLFTLTLAGNAVVFESRLPLFGLGSQEFAIMSRNETCVSNQDWGRVVAMESRRKPIHEVSGIILCG